MRIPGNPFLTGYADRILPDQVQAVRIIAQAGNAAAVGPAAVARQAGHQFRVIVKILCYTDDIPAAFGHLGANLFRSFRPRTIRINVIGQAVNVHGNRRKGSLYCLSSLCRDSRGRDHADQQRQGKHNAKDFVSYMFFSVHGFTKSP